MNNKLMLFVVFLISILSVGCVCAADMAITDSSDIGGSLDIDDSISQDLASEHSSGERPLMELPRGYENKTGDVDVLMMKSRTTPMGLLLISRIILI